MGREPAKKKSMKDYFDAYKSLNIDDTLKATKAEASRQFNQMDRWAKKQLADDPEDMLWEYQERNIFGMIDQARKYRGRIYDRNRKITNEIAPQHRVASEEYQKTGSPEALARTKELLKQSTEEIDQQIVYCWRIYKIFCLVNAEIAKVSSDGTDTYDPLAIEE